MRLKDTPEMTKLKKQFRPYIKKDGSGFEDGTPLSAIEARKKFIELAKAQYEDALKYVM